MDIGKAIIAREKTLLIPEVRASAGKLRELLSSEFREVGASGAYFGLAEVLEWLPSEHSWSAHTQDWEFRMLSEEIAQTIHRAFVRRDDQDSGTYSRRTSIWRNESGVWRMLYHQGTKVEPFELQL